LFNDGVIAITVVLAIVGSGGAHGGEIGAAEIVMLTALSASQGKMYLTTGYLATL